MKLLLPLKKAFSDSARKAALEARRAKAAAAMKEGAPSAPVGHGRGRKLVPNESQRKYAEEQAAKQGPGLHIKVSQESERARLGLNYDPPKVTTDHLDATSVSHTAETDPAHKMKTPDTRGIHVRTEHRPVDYGAAGELLREKYGEKRGEKMYESMIDGPSARFFQAGTKIVAEKMAMMNELGKVGKPSNHHYQGLHQKWVAKQKAGGKK